METISKFKFILGIVIVSISTGFLISIPFAGILNTNDVSSSSVVKGSISLIINGLSLFLAFLYAIKVKKYILPATNKEISLLIGLGFFALAVISLILTSLSFGSFDILGFVSPSVIFGLLINSLIAAGVSYLSIKFFYKQE